MENLCPVPEVLRHKGQGPPLLIAGDNNHVYRLSFHSVLNVSLSLSLSFPLFLSLSSQFFSLSIFLRIYLSLYLSFVIETCRRCPCRKECLTAATMSSTGEENIIFCITVLLLWEKQILSKKRLFILKNSATLHFPAIFAFGQIRFLKHWP
jgi:hypothetical protein